MFTRIVVFVLLVAFAMQTFQKALIVLDYYANTEIFAQNCVNKSRPELKCKGKCQMMKKIQAEEEKAQQHPEQKSQKNIEPSYPLQTASLYTPAWNFMIMVYPDYPVAQPADRSQAIFHPPALL